MKCNRRNVAMYALASRRDGLRTVVLACFDIIEELRLPSLI